MHRLVDHLARRRILYRSSLLTAPSVLVIDVPPGSRGSNLSLGRYYPIILETEGEVAEVEGFLEAPRVKLLPPNLFDRRPSNLQTDNILISRYDPPERGWPWLSICRWPSSYASGGEAMIGEMARGCYSMEMFETANALDAHCVLLVQLLREHHDINLRMISADNLPAAGYA
jgi:hypothetical protein